MHIVSLKFGGLGRFHAEVIVPIEELGDARLVALVGITGAGKTTAMETVPGAVYRTTPSRGPLAKLAGAKTSFVEMVVDCNGRHVCKIMIDGTLKTPKAEAYLIGPDGEPINDGKVSTYDKAIAERFASSDVFLASAFACQKKHGSFLKIPVAKRRELFVEMIGCGALQKISDAAGKHVRAANEKLTKLRARKEALEGAWVNAKALRWELDTARDAEAAAKEQLDVVQDAAKNADRRVREWGEKNHELKQTATEARAELASARSVRDAIADANIGLSDKETALRAKTAGLGARLGQRAALEAEAAAGDEATDQLEAVEAEMDRRRDEQQQHVRDLAAWSSARDELQRAVSEAERRHAAARDAAETDLATAEKERTRARAQARRDIDRQIADASDHLERRQKEEERSKKAAARIDSVPCGGVGEYSGCELISDAVAEAARLDEREHATRAAGQAAARARATSVEDDPAVAAATADVEAKTAALDKARSDDTAVRQAHDALKAHPEEPGPPAPMTDLEARLTSLRRRSAAATDARAKLGALREIEQQLGGLREEIGELAAEIDRGIDKLAVAGEAVERATGAAAAAVAAAEAHASRQPPAADPDALSSARGAVTAAVAAVAATQAKLEAATEAAADLAAIRAAITGELEELDDWAHIQKAYGPRGIQALEIDCAGPEVSGLINRLIHSGYGSRFTCELRTTAPTNDGGTKEIFDLNVIDSEMGTDGSVDNLSGGEETIVGEAISIAIAIYNTRRSSIPMLDLFRDECSGALSAGHAIKYVRMLLRALDLGGFRRCYFVAHQPPLWRLADERILFENGGCRLADDIPDEAVAA
jgi:exonuclease SbcC